jgi:hypothetical protein
LKKGKDVSFEVIALLYDKFTDSPKYKPIRL